MTDNKTKDISPEDRKWCFRAFTTQQAYRSGRFFDEHFFTDHAEMKVFSAEHSAKYKPTYPNYCSTYFDVKP
jgi:hypothetical protein